MDWDFAILKMITTYHSNAFLRNQELQFAKQNKTYQVGIRASPCQLVISEKKNEE